MTKAARFRVTPECLRELLGLPEDATIHALSVEPSIRWPVTYDLLLVVEHDDLPVGPVRNGYVLSEITPCFVQDGAGQKLLRWDTGA